MGIAMAFAAYWGLAFTPIEAVLSGSVISIISLLFFERNMRLRAESRLEKGIEDLSRLLSTNAQAGQILSKRVNKIADMNISSRVDIVEADISVLGTIVRQLAEAVAQLEEAQANDASNETPNKNEQIEQNKKNTKIPAKEVQKALDENRIIIHASPIISLPKREILAYDLSAQMQLENGQMILADEFMPTMANDNIAIKIDYLAFKELFEYLESNGKKEPLLPLHVPISNATLNDNMTIEWLLAQLEVSRENANIIVFSISQQQWNEMQNQQQLNLQALLEKGATISIRNVDNLRMDFTLLKQKHVSSVCVSANSFINEIDKLTDYQSTDVASYISRFGIDLIVSDVKNEEELLILLEDGIKQIFGEHISLPKPAQIMFAENSPISREAG